MTFESLRELVQLVSLKKIKHLGEVSELKGKMMDLYRCIASGKIQSHEEAARYLYGSKDFVKAYEKLCERLKKKLIALSLLTTQSPPGAPQHIPDVYELYKDFAAAEILYGKGARKASVELMSNVHWRALRYEVTWMALESANFIRQMLSRDHFERRTWRQYNTQYEKLTKIKSREELAVRHYEIIITEYIAKQPENRMIHEKASALYAELLPIQKDDTVRYISNTYLIGIISQMACENYPEAIKLADDLYAKLQNRKYVSRGLKYNAVMQKFYCNIQLKDLDGGAGEQTAALLMSLCTKGDPYWTVFMQYNFYYKTYIKDYPGALNIYWEVSSSPRFAKMGALQFEQWLLFSGYLHLLFMLGEINTSPFVGKHKNGFKILPFMGQFKLLTLDRSGLSLPLHLLPYLHNILNNTPDANGFSNEALLQFKKRHTHTPVNTRTRYFIMLLLRLNNHRAKKNTTDRRENRYVEILKNTPPPLLGQSFRIEIIPYQNLWTLLKQYVSSKRPRSEQGATDIS